MQMGGKNPCIQFALSLIILTFVGNGSSLEDHQHRCRPPSRLRQFAKLIADDLELFLILRVFDRAIITKLRKLPEAYG